MSSENQANTAEADGEQATDVVKALATLPDAPDEALSTHTPIRPDQAREAIPEGSVITTDEDTWSPDLTGKGGTIAIRVEPPGGPAADYLAVMTLEEGQWRVLSTLELLPEEDDS